MSKRYIANALRSAHADLEYWQERLERAIGSDDRDDAIEAMGMLRRYKWFIDWIEGRAFLIDAPE
jgi:hypothetical protein